MGARYNIIITEFITYIIPYLPLDATIQLLVSLPIQRLIPSDPKFKWVDHGIVVQSVAGRDMWNAIDPNVAIDDKGNPWMVFGSFWMGMKLVNLQPNMIAIVADSTRNGVRLRPENDIGKLTNGMQVMLPTLS